jgi:hypothetical protein
MCVYLDVWMLLLHLDLSVRALRLHGRFRRPAEFKQSIMALRRSRDVRETFFYSVRKASGDTRRVAARAGIGCIFSLERDSMLPYHMWFIQTRDL